MQCLPKNKMLYSDFLFAATDDFSLNKIKTNAKNLPEGDTLEKC